MSLGDVKEVQHKILDTMIFIDKLCLENNIDYCIMGGTALGAARHGGFIPWDDDLDIFMTPENYEKFKKVFLAEKNNQFMLQEWRTTPKYLEYAKVRMNNTAFIESHFKERVNMHQGIYVDIMILHKCSENLLEQKLVYFYSKYLVLYGLYKRNWKPKSSFQKIILTFIKYLPNKFLLEKGYKYLYSFDNLQENYVYSYFITKAKFKQGIFPRIFFDEIEKIKFENTVLKAPKKIKEYLEYRYGNYMKLPSEEEQRASVHAEIFDVEKDFSTYFKNSEYFTFNKIEIQE